MTKRAGRELLVVMLLLLVSGLAAAADESASTPYLDTVRRAADGLLENARDTYGSQHSGMVLSVLDCHTCKPLAELPKAPAGVRYGDRTGVGGSNANLQQDLYRALHHLSRITGDRRYTDAAHAALVDFLRITQHPDTGLLAWGEHLYWNCVEDRLGDLDPNRTHEPKRKLVFFNELYEVEPERTLNYARGLWDHQIADQKTGDFSRHAKYDRHAPGTGYDFPKEGSYFISTWSQAYEKTREPVYREAVTVLATRYLNRTNELNLLEWESTGRPGRTNKCVPLWMVSLALESHDAAQRMDPETAELLSTLARRQDTGFLNLRHAPDDPERGFVFFAFTNSGSLRPDKLKETDGHSRHWGLGYGVHATSMFGLLSYSRQAQLGSGPAAEDYRKLVIQAADLYVGLPPDPQQNDLWAGEYGTAILLEIAAHRLTGDTDYLDAARRLGDHATEALWDEGRVLPRASTKTSYYDVVSYADTLMLALLALHEHVAGLDPRVPISDLIR